MRMAKLVSEGKGNAEICREFGIKKRSCENQLNAIYRTLGVTGMTNPRLQVALIVLSGGYDVDSFRAALDYSQALARQKQVSLDLELSSAQLAQARAVLEKVVNESD
jgi:hypothetical protein